MVPTHGESIWSAWCAGRTGAESQDSPIFSSINVRNDAPLHPDPAMIIKLYASWDWNMAHLFPRGSRCCSGAAAASTPVALPSASLRRWPIRLHPALLDACLDLYPALIDAYGDFTQGREPPDTDPPVRVERFRCACVSVPEVWAHGVRRQTANGGGDIVTVDIAIFQDDGRLAAAIEGLSLKPLPPEALRPQLATAAVEPAKGEQRKPARQYRAWGSAPVRWRPVPDRGRGMRNA